MAIRLQLSSQSFISARGKLARAQLSIPAWISSLKETTYIKGLLAIEADERDLGSSRNRQASVNTYLKASLVMVNKFTLRACLLTWRWGTPGKWGKPPVHIISYSGHLTYHVNVIKLK